MSNTSYSSFSKSNNQKNLSDYSQIQISIASPEKIISWSHGEVVSPDTKNYRTMKAEKGGLFCTKIFGPVKNYECQCGKYKTKKYEGLKCDKCGVEVTTSRVRRERMGHISLVTPICNTLFFKSSSVYSATTSNIVGKLLGGLDNDLSRDDITDVSHYEKYIVTDSKMSDLEDNQILSETEYNDAVSKYGADGFEALMGGEGIRKCLEKIDLNAFKEKLLQKIKNFDETKKSIDKKKKLIQKYKVVNYFINSAQRPEWMVLTVLPVLPPDLRPLIAIDGGQFARADLNELYRRVIIRNNRLKKLIELNAPDVIVKNEKRMLQESVDALFDNTSLSKPITNSAKQPFKSLSDMLKGKRGRFRQNLLGKRVDYSGRSVIVVGPELKLNQCGLPKKMALELFKPFIYAKLEDYGYSSSIRESKRMVENEAPEVWDILEEVVKDHPVLLNRAPTLHRISIQAFNPVLIEGNAIQLHPLTCKAFNADFDGDQMSVHIPLSVEAQIEAKTLMMSTNNIISPQSGKPIIGPGQDMMFGLYYITLSSDKNKDNPTPISNLAEMEYALFSKNISLHDYIIYRFKVLDKKTNEWIYKREITTPGRVKLFEIIPESARLLEVIPLINKVVKKKDMNKILDFIYKNSSQQDTCDFADKMMELGFKESCKSGLSVGKDDMIISKDKWKKIEEAEKDVEQIEKDYLEGMISGEEKTNKIIDRWSRCSDFLRDDLKSNISSEKEPTKMNSLWMMIDSGARGSISQVQQVGAMRGLVTKASGAVIETPILSNLKEGLNILEYFISANIARKGLTDTALKTANAGYLTRKFVDVAQDCVVVEDDCGTTNGITLTDKRDHDQRVITPLSERALGRVLAEDLKINGKTLIKAGELIDEKYSELIKEKNIKQIKVRSPITCGCKDGICAKCYGADLTTGKLVALGEPVGIVAAQAIGEPGTQLTMNTKHLSSGGVAINNEYRAIDDDVVTIENYKIIKDSKNQIINISNNAVLILKDGTKYDIPYGAIIEHENGTEIKKGDKIVSWDPYYKPILATKSLNKIELTNVFTISRDNQSIVREPSREEKKDIKEYNILFGDGDFKQKLPVDAILNVKNGDKVKEGDVLARIPIRRSRGTDITAGLPGLIKTFEIVKTEGIEKQIFAKFDGVIKYESKNSISLVSNDEPKRTITYRLKETSVPNFADGESVKKGDILVDGRVDINDILEIFGIERFTEEMIKNASEIYESQGITINDKHFEIIFKQMLKNVQIDDSGDTGINEEYVDKDEIEKVNNEMLKNGLKPATYHNVVLGLTRSALNSKSFISATSFQSTKNILVDSAIQGKIDNLLGVKENVILGRLIPAGTGLLINKFKQSLRKEEALKEEEMKAQEDLEQKLDTKKEPEENKKSNEKKSNSKKDGKKKASKKNSKS